MEFTVYNLSDGGSNTINAPQAVFDQPTRTNLLHSVVTAAQANKRQPVAHTKDRRDRRGGGKKPWRQKGTGRARHGSIRSPIWKGGGVTFGPRNAKKFKKKVNKKAKKAALASALSAKARDEEVLFVDSLDFDEPSAKQARGYIEELADLSDLPAVKERRKNALLILVPETEENQTLSYRNFGNTALKTATEVNALDVLTYKFVAIIEPERTLDVLESRVAKKVTQKA